MSFFDNLALVCSKQRKIPYRMRRSLMKRVAPNLLHNYAFKTKMDGGAHFSGNLVNYIDRMIYFCGAHEKYMLHFLNSYVSSVSANPREEIVFLDIGANAGNHTLYMAYMVRQIYAFEPFERVRSQLEKNISINNINNAKILPFGLSNKNDKLPFYAGPDENLGASSFQADHYKTSELIGTGEIRIGDEFIEENNIAKVHIIKADVEGFEGQVLEGLSETIKRDRPLIIIELSTTTRKYIGDEAAFKKLFPENYNFFYFSRGSRDSGNYQIAPFKYDLSPKLQDVIAIPAEVGVDGVD